MALYAGDYKVAYVAGYFFCAITHAASQVKHMTLHERQGDFFEGIERKVVAGDLLLKLSIEKGDALIGDHPGP